MSRWYSVDKKLPKKDQHVLVTVENTQIMSKMPHFFDRFISLAQYKGEGNFGIREVCYPGAAVVTHWTAIPSFPRKPMKINDAWQALLILIVATLFLAANAYLNWDNLPKFIPEKSSEQSLEPGENK